MEWQHHQKATPSEGTFASSGRRVSAHPLEGLEPQAASTGVSAPSPSSTRGGADRTRSFFRSNAPTSASVSCAAGALSADVSRAADSQCSRFHIWAGDHQTVRRLSRLCHLARPGDSLNRALATLSPRTGLLLRVNSSDLFPSIFLPVCPSRSPFRCFCSP